MLTLQTASSLAYSEHPVMFPNEGHGLFGVFTNPVEPNPRGLGVVLLTGGSYIASQNRNRLSVRLARLLAGRGFPVFRFDYHGVGESEGAIEGYPLGRPFVDDLQAALGWLQVAGVRKFILVGSCFGARTIAATAGRAAGVAGLVMISTPMADSEMGDARPVHYARRLSTWQLIRKATRPRTILNLIAPRTRENRLRGRQLAARTIAMKLRAVIDRVQGNSAESWLSEPLVRQLSTIIRQRIPTLLLFGEEETFYRDFSEARSGPLKPVLESGEGKIEVQTVPGVLHGFTSLRVQDEVIERTMTWIRAYTE